MTDLPRGRLSNSGLKLTAGARFNQTEHLFEAKAKATGWSVSKRGWPDFIIRKGTDVRFVEVKVGEYRARKEQVETLKLLASRGFKCYLWTPERGFMRVSTGTFVPYEQKPRNPCLPKGIPLKRKKVRHSRALTGTRARVT